jgi:hypothetical protein
LAQFEKENNSICGRRGNPSLRTSTPSTPKYDASQAYIQSQQYAGWTMARSKYDDGSFSGGNTDRLKTPLTVKPM